MKTPVDHAARSKRARSSGIGTKTSRPMNYDRQKSAHTGSALAVSGVDANVLRLKSHFRNRAIGVRRETAIQESLAVAVAGEVLCRQHRQQANPAVAVVVLVRTGARFLFWRRRTRRTTTRPSAKSGLGPAAASSRLSRGCDARTALGQDHHLGKQPREAQAGNQAGGGQPSSCEVNGTHHVNYHTPNGCRQF